MGNLQAICQETSDELVSFPLLRDFGRLMTAAYTDERRIFVIVVLLAAALFLTAILTWQAVMAGTYHRFAAQRAIRDFAAIAGDELIRRAAVDVEGYGFAPMRQAIAVRLSRGEGMPTLEQVRTEGDGRLDYSMPLVHQLFMADVNARSVTPPVPKALETWMLTRFVGVARERRRNGDPQAVRVDAGGEQYLLAYGVLQIDAGRIFGFIVMTTLSARSCSVPSRDIRSFLSRRAGGT
jgi:hypothetical protein